MRYNIFCKVTWSDHMLKRLHNFMDGYKYLLQIWFIIYDGE